MDARRVVVTVSEPHLDRVDDVARDLRGAGMVVEEILTELGIVIGQVPEEDFAALARVGGVESVERESRAEIAPPDSDVQ